MDRRGFLAAGTACAALAAASPALGAGKEKAGKRTLPAQAAIPRVAVSDFGSSPGALQRAVDTAAREVVVDTDVTVTTDILLRSDQILRFAGGRIIVAAHAKIAHGVLYNSGGANITLAGAIIDANAKRAGVIGVKLISVDGARIEGGRLTRAHLWLETNDNRVDRRTRVADLKIDMAGVRETAIYLSGVRGVVLQEVECFAGREGIGIYNGARDIKMIAVRSHHHSQDGFVIIDGKRIAYADCVAEGNGQSGFCTQDLAPGMGAQFVTWTNCEAHHNAADGFDIHGLKGAVHSEFRLVRCIARQNGPNNGGCGYYILTAPGTTLDNCSASNNRFQGLFINGCDHVIAKGFRSASNADAIAPGPNKAGILVYNSDAVQIENAVSGNHKGTTQEYGVSFTGTSKRARVVGGDLSNNRIRPLFAEADVILARS